MMELDKQSVQCFIDDDPRGYYTKPGLLWQTYFFSALILVPTLLCGVYSDVTKYFLPVVLILGIWLLYLSSDLDKKKVSCILFLCILYSCFFFGCITGAYKLVSMITEVQTISVIIVIVLYFFISFLDIKNILKQISEGYYCLNERKVNKNMFAITAAGYLLGVGIARSMNSHISQNGGIMLVGAFLLLFSLVMLLKAGRFMLKNLLIHKLSLYDR